MMDKISQEDFGAEAGGYTDSTAPVHSGGAGGDIGVLLLAVCILGGVIYVTHRDKAENDVFTDTFFKGMTGISPFMVDNMLEGEAADDVVSFLKSLHLQPTADTMPPNDYFGCHQGFCVYYQDGTNVLFQAKGAMIKIRFEQYYVLDENGERETDFGDTFWNREPAVV